MFVLANLVLSKYCLGKIRLLKCSQRRMEGTVSVNVSSGVIHSIDRVSDS